MGDESLLDLTSGKIPNPEGAVIRCRDDAPAVHHRHTFSRSLMAYKGLLNLAGGQVPGL
jgi:hypothetical protein